MSIDINVSNIDGQIKREYPDYNVTKYIFEHDTELRVKIPKDEVVKHIVIYSWERFNHITLSYHTITEKYRFNDKFKHVITPLFRISSNINNTLYIKSNIFSSRVFVYLITYENYVCDKTVEERLLAEHAKCADGHKCATAAKKRISVTNGIPERISAAL
jgi:hypothetical protein